MCGRCCGGGSGCTAVLEENEPLNNGEFGECGGGGGGEVAAWRAVTPRQR